MATATKSRRKSQAGGELLDHTPPHDDEAEISVIGSILCLPEVLDELTPILSPQDFWDPRLATVYGRLLAMHGKNKRIDLTLLRNTLVAADEWSDDPNDTTTPNAVLLSKAMNSVATSAHAAAYATIVSRDAIARDLRLAGGEVIRTAHDAALEGPDLLNRAEEQVFKVRERRSTGVESVATIAEVVQRSLAALTARESRKVADGVAAGFHDIDAMLSLCDGELAILAARPSMGKTALATNIAGNAAVDGVQVLFASLEMRGEQIADRLLASIARVDQARMRNGSISNEERARIVEASCKLSLMPLTLDDSPTRTVLEIAATARRLKRKKGLGLVVVDYLQLIQPDDPRAPRQQQVAQIAARLKTTARELSVPVLCLSQLNRQAEARSDNKPKLSDLRESGAIEQDADVVMLIHREEYYRPTADNRGKAELIIAKNRNGQTGTVELGWQPEYASFVSLAKKVF